MAGLILLTVTVLGLVAVTGVWLARSIQQDLAQAEHILEKILPQTNACLATARRVRRAVPSGAEYARPTQSRIVDDLSPHRDDPFSNPN